MSYKKDGVRVSAIAALAVILGFFLPWGLVSCGSVQIEMSGHDLAAGTAHLTGSLSHDYTAEEGIITPQPILYFVLVAGFVVGILSARQYVFDRISAVAAVIQALLALVALGIVGKVALSLKDQFAEYTSLSYKHGLFATLLGLGGMLVGSFVYLVGWIRDPGSSDDDEDSPT